MLSTQNRFRVACWVSLLAAGVLFCEGAEGRGVGGRGFGGGGYRAGGYRGGFAATGATGPGGFGRGYYASTGYTRGQVANTYAAMGYRPYGLTTPGYGYGYGSGYWPYYGGYGYNPYSYGYYPYSYGVNYNVNYDPSEYLQGAASVYNAQGNFLVKQAESQKIQTQVKAAQIENQRKAFDQAMYERQHTPTAAEIRAQELEDSFRRSMADPPLSLIVSGQALNDLLVGLVRKLDPKKPVPEVPLDQSQLRQINVTSGEQRTSAAMLQDHGKVDWPILLQGAEQKQLDLLIPQAIDQAVKMNRVAPALLNQINDEMDKLVDRLDGEVNSGDITPNQHIQAKRFLNNLRVALRALRQPNARDYFNGMIAAKGDTVGQLVQYMTQNNLRFTPALPGEEEAYVELHHRMVAQAYQASEAATASASTGFRVRLAPALSDKPAGGVAQ